MNNTLSAGAGSRRLRRSRKTPSEAVANILKLRKGVKVGGLKIVDMIREGRKY